MALRSSLQVVNCSRPPEAVDRIQPRTEIKRSILERIACPSERTHYLHSSLSSSPSARGRRVRVVTYRSADPIPPGRLEKKKSVLAIGGNRRLSLSKHAVHSYAEVRRVGPQRQFVPSPRASAVDDVQASRVRPRVENALPRRHPQIKETQRSWPVRVKVYLATIAANIGADVRVRRTQFRHQGGRSEGASTSQPSDVDVIQPQSPGAVAAEIQQWNAIVVILEIARPVIIGI